MVQQITRHVNIRCLEERNPPPELKIDNGTGVIQINITKHMKRIIPFPDNSVLPIHEESSQHTDREGDKIDNLCLFCDNMSRIWRMFYKLEVPGDCSEDVRKSISQFVADTAKRVIRGSARMKSFLVYVELEVIIEDSNDHDVDDGYERISDNEDMDMASDEEITSDDEFTSDNNEVNMVVALSLDAYENTKVGASRSAINGLKREIYSYESGGDNPAKNNSDTNTCVICMDKFESGTVVTYMPCSHIFHEVCLVPWLQDNNSCPLCRLEIQSCS
ncbi:hypothetical protein MKX01_000227 [Papaver californicum]|nr:hypothetical protein MKX01_000227 [Papaver californicum]